VPHARSVRAAPFLVHFTTVSRSNPGNHSSFRGERRS
jgi:hypothetical protein